MNYRELNNKTIRQGFIDFHRANPDVFKAFEDQTLLAIKAGRSKISAKLILNWIRWNKEIQGCDESFKINDAYQAYFARHFVQLHPEHREIFNFRKLRNEEDGPYMGVEEDGQIYFL